MELLLSQKDDLFELIKEFEGFSPNQFELKLTNRKSQTSVKFNNSKYYFNFCIDDRGMWTNYSPGNEQLEDATGYTRWEETIIIFNNWLFFLQRELTTPNHWDNFKNQIAGLNFNTNYDNEKFSYNEYIVLENKMNLLKRQLDILPLLAEQNIDIKNHLDRLTEKAKDLGKFDWKSLFIGTIVTIITTLQVTPENASALWELIKSVFNTYFIE